MEMHLKTEECLSKAMQPNQDISSPGMLPKFGDRKQSHELNSVRNQLNSDEDRIKKLTDFSMSKKIERQRNQQMQQYRTATSGRDDPSNIVGFQKLKEPPMTAIKAAAAARISSHDGSRRLLDPLKDIQRSKKAMVNLSHVGPED